MKVSYPSRRNSFIHCTSLFDITLTLILYHSINTFVFISLLPSPTKQIYIMKASNLANINIDDDFNWNKSHAVRGAKYNLNESINQRGFYHRLKRRKWSKVPNSNQSNIIENIFNNSNINNFLNTSYDVEKYLNISNENKSTKDMEKLKIDDNIRQNIYTAYNTTLSRKSTATNNVIQRTNVEFNNIVTETKIENHTANTEYAKLNYTTQYSVYTDNPVSKAEQTEIYFNNTNEDIYSVEYEFNQTETSRERDRDVNTNTSLALNKKNVTVLDIAGNVSMFDSELKGSDAATSRESRTNESLQTPFPIRKASSVQFSRGPLTSLRPDLMQVSKSAHSRIVSILGLFELSIGDVPRSDGVSELAAAKLAVAHVNEQGILPGYVLQLITNDTKCDPGVGVDRFFHALYTEQESRMVMLLGTACSEVTESIAKIVPYWNIVQVSFGSTSPALSDRNEFPLFCRTVAPDSSHNMARIAFIRRFGWDTVTAFSQNEEVYSLAVNELVTQLEAANITCAASITFAESDFKEQLLQLKELDTRIIIGSFSKEMLPKIFCEAHKLGMFGAQYAWLVAGTPNSLLSRYSGDQPCPNTVLQQALEGLVMVDAHGGTVGEDITLAGLTNQKFIEEMSSIGVPLSPYAAQTYDAVWAIALALRNAENSWEAQSKLSGHPSQGISYFDYNRKDMAEEFLNQIENLSFIGISGPLSFHGPDRIGVSAFYQIQGGQPRTIALYSQGQQVCSDCPDPHWAGGVPIARRILVLRVDSVWAPARLAVTALAGCGVALSLGFLLFNLHYSKRRSIKLSSPRLNSMTLIGCVLVYTAVALLGVDNTILPNYVPFSAMCTCRVYILSAGFSLAFGSMFAKTYRVHRIFISNRTGVCKTKLLQDTPLIFLVCALLLIDGMIVTLWASLDPMERQLKNLTKEMSSDDRSVIYQPQIEICKSHNTTGWLCALYAYKGLLLIVGVYMAWETRNVKITALNDSKYIGISVYSVVITSISVVVIGTIISERATLAYITITSLILITTTSTLCLLFLPKIIAIRSNTEDDPVTQSLGLKLECKTRRFVTDETQELHFRIEIQNKVYRREVAALDKEIGRLERLLAEPLDSARGSSASISLKRYELNTVDEEGRDRTPSISGGLPMLLLSVLPPVIPRASWPSAEAFRGRNSVSFSSQPKLNYRKSQPSIDLYNLCLNKREENPGLLKRLKSFFGSRPNSRKASTMSIADPTGQSIAAALKMHVGMIAGLVPSNRKHSMVLSCNTLNVPSLESRLRRESFARSGPIIRVTDDEPTCSTFEMNRPPNKYIAEPETKVNFVLPPNHKLSHQNSSEKFKGSPRFPHRISPTGSSITILDRRKTSADSVFNISIKSFDEQRRFSQQNVSDNSKGKTILESKWKSTEDASPSTSRS